MQKNDKMYLKSFTNNVEIAVPMCNLK